jgi:hypothetical protein
MVSSHLLKLQKLTRYLYAKEESTSRAGIEPTTRWLLKYSREKVFYSHPLYRWSYRLIIRDHSLISLLFSILSKRFFLGKKKIALITFPISFSLLLFIFTVGAPNPFSFPIFFVLLHTTPPVVIEEVVLRCILHVNSYGKYRIRTYDPLRVKQML